MTSKADIKKVLNLVKKVGADDIHLKFVDLLGKWHQIALPASYFTAAVFTKGVHVAGSGSPGVGRRARSGPGLVRPFHGRKRERAECKLHL